jgi:hypothetical protein
VRLGGANQAARRASKVRWLGHQAGNHLPVVGCYECVEPLMDWLLMHINDRSDSFRYFLSRERTIGTDEHVEGLSGNQREVRPASSLRSTWAGCPLRSPSSLPVDLFTKWTHAQAGHQTATWTSAASKSSDEKSSNRCCTFFPVRGHLKNI